MFVCYFLDPFFSTIIKLQIIESGDYDLTKSLLKKKISLQIYVTHFVIFFRVMNLQLLSEGFIA